MSRIINCRVIVMIKVWEASGDAHSGDARLSKQELCCCFDDDGQSSRL